MRPHLRSGSLARTSRRPPGFPLVPLLLGGLLLEGCDGPQGDRAFDVLAGGQAGVVEAWLSCTDLCDSSRVAVQNLGDEAVPLLGTELDPLPFDLQAAIERRLGEAYRRSGIDPAVLPESVYVARFLDNQLARRQLHAVVALDSIYRIHQSTAARDELIEARERLARDETRYRSDVVRALQRAVDLGDPDREVFPGFVPTDVAFLDTVVLREASEDDFDGNELASLRGSPFSEDLIVGQGFDTLALVAVGEPGAYPLVIDSVGPNDELEQTAELEIVSFVYTPATPDAPRDIDSLTRRRPAFSILTAEAPDDFFRVQPNRSGTLTLVADQSRLYTARIGISVKECGAYAVGADELVVTVVDERGDAVADAPVTVDGLTIGSTDARGHIITGSLGQPSVVVDVLRENRIVVRDTVPVGTSDAILVVPAPGGSTPDFSHPDTVAMPVSATDCWLARLHAYAIRAPAIVKLEAELEEDGVPPAIGALNPAPVGAVTNAASIIVTIGSRITDETVLQLVRLTVRVDGTDASGAGGNGACEDTDHPLDVTGGEIDRQSVELQNGTNVVDFSGPRREAFTIPRPGLGNVRYCFTIEATDSATDSSGNPSPNTTTSTTAIEVEWS